MTISLINSVNRQVSFRAEDKQPKPEPLAEKIKTKANKFIDDSKKYEIPNDTSSKRISREALCGFILGLIIRGKNQGVFASGFKKMIGFIGLMELCGVIYRVKSNSTEKPVTKAVNEIIKESSVKDKKENTAETETEIKAKA